MLRDARAYSGRVPAVRPELGPTLPALVRARFGVPERVTVAAAVLLVLGAVALALGFRPGDPTRQIVHRGDPVFNVLHDAGEVRRTTPGPGELLRLEARGRRRAPIAFAVRTLRFERGPGLPTGALALRAERHLDELRRGRPDLVTRALGKARVNDAPGFEVAYRFGPPQRRTYVRDVLVVPEDPRAGDALLLRLAQVARGRLGPRERARALPMREALGSFRYGTEPEER